MFKFLSNDEIISPSNWTSLFCSQFFLIPTSGCIAGLRKYFLGRTNAVCDPHSGWAAEGKRDRPSGGVIVLPLLSEKEKNNSDFIRAGSTQF